MVDASFGMGPPVTSPSSLWLLSEEQIESALHEVGVDAEAVLELDGWKTTSENVAVAKVPFPGGKMRGCWG